MPVPFLHVVGRNWFILSIFLCIVLAKTYPEFGKKNGVLHPEVTVKYVAIIIIFFNSGLSLRTEELSRALFSWWIHLFIQSFTFGFVPALMIGLSQTLLPLLFGDGVVEGFLLLSCMPPPVSSAVILTKTAGGNEAASLFNSAFGSLLGIFITPLLILLVVGSYQSVPYSDVVRDLLFTVLIPIIIGQILRRYYKWYRIPHGNISSVILVFIIYTTFCDAFTHDLNIDVYTVLTLIVYILILQITLIGLIFHVTTTYFKRVYTCEDVISLLYCSTHKSLTLGIPIIKIIFPTSPHLSLLTLPLLIYHPTQIVLGGLIVHKLNHWISQQHVNVKRVKSETV